MRGFVAAFAGAVGLLWCAAAAAEADTGAASIAGACTATGAFGERFGATAVNGRPHRVGLVLNAENVAIDPAFAPFTDAEVVFSQSSGRVHRITGSAEYASDAEADAAYAAAVRAFAADPRFLAQPSGDEESAAYHFTNPVSAAGFRVELYTSGKTLLLACVDLARQQSATQEWRQHLGFGPTPPAAPAVGQAWDAAAVAQTHCTREGGFGQRFGQRLVGRSRAGFTEYNRTLTSRVSFPPFQHFEATITPRSRVVISITAKASFANATEASSAYAALVAAYQATGRFPRQSQDTLISGPAGISFSSDESLLDGYGAFVALAGNEVQVVCSDNAGLTRAFEEAFPR